MPISLLLSSGAHLLLVAVLLLAPHLLSRELAEPVEAGFEVAFVSDLPPSPDAARAPSATPGPDSPVPLPPTPPGPPEPDPAPPPPAPLPPPPASPALAPEPPAPEPPEPRLLTPTPPPQPSQPPPTVRPTPPVPPPEPTPDPLPVPPRHQEPQQPAQPERPATTTPVSPRAASPPPSASTQATPAQRPQQNSTALDNTMDRLRRQQSSTARPAAGPSSPGQQAAQGQTRAGPAASLTRGEINAIADQISECFSVDAGMLDLDRRQVMLRVDIDDAGTIRNARPAEGGIPTDPRDRALFEQARRALLDSRCAKLPVPPEKIAALRDTTFRFSPRGLVQ